MIPMTLSAQREKKETLTNGVALNGSRSSLLRKNAPAPADRQVLKISPSIMGSKSLRRARKAAPSADAIIWDFEGESDFDQFICIDDDDDGFNWEYHYNGTYGSMMTTHEGRGIVFSASYDNENSTSLTPDNWLISPEVTLGGVLSFWACGQQDEYDLTKCSVSLYAWATLPTQAILFRWVQT